MEKDFYTARQEARRREQLEWALQRFRQEAILHRRGVYK